jgi:hypothetical protein
MEYGYQKKQHPVMRAAALVGDNGHAKAATLL